MKIPLQYQRTEYDCGPTSLLNAISYLLHREEIPPDILRFIMIYTLDSYNTKGEAYKNGTSRMAMLFLSAWLNNYAKSTKFSLTCEYLKGEEVHVRESGKILEALRQGGAVVVRLSYGCEHYVTLTGLSENGVALFDPYYRIRPFKKHEITMITDKPYYANRNVDLSVLEQTKKQPYALGPIEDREAVLLFNPNTRKTPERTIEYFI